MSSEQEQFVLKLFDYFWFNNSVLSKASRRRSSSPAAVAKDDEEQAAAPKLSSLSGRAPSMIIGRPISDQALSSKDDHQSDSDSSNTPKSVLGMQRRPPALETILSGKEVGEFAQVKTTISRSNSRKGGRLRRNGSSRSLSELEYKELKGFMDLGFVFPDEDKDSSLVSIIPGLQRLGRKDSNNSAVPRRPYLSEAWDVQDLNNKQPPLMVNWRIPAFGNEIELKHHLKFWAHTVASTVR